MKKILALALVALMVVPFGIFASAAQITVPAEPTLTATDKAYIGYGANNALGIPASTDGGQSIASILDTSKSSTSWPARLWEDLVPNGGKIVVVSKGYCHKSQTFPATTTPILFTAVDGNTDYTSRHADGSFDYKVVNQDTGAVSNGGQLGMFIINASATFTFEGDVIFEDIAFLCRNANNDATRIPVLQIKKNLVVKDSVDFLKMAGDVGFNLDVAEGAFAYLHAAGFEDYIGKGTIVIGDEIKNTVTEDMFANFEGKVVDKDGKELFTEEDPGQTPSNPGTTPENPGTTPENPGTTPDAPSNPSTGDMTFVIVAIALASVAGAVLTLKKREQR